METRSSSKSSKIGSRKKTTSTSCLGCGQHFLTLHQLINHFKISPNPCKSFLRTCKGCGKHFAEESSLNRHLGQMASCRFQFSKADIASFVEYIPNEATTPLIISTQSAEVKKTNNIPKMISFQTPSHNVKSVPSSPMVSQRKHQLDYYIHIAQTYFNTCVDSTDCCVRLNPSLLFCTSTPPTNSTPGTYDDYILQIVLSLDSTKDLGSTHGIPVLPLFIEQMKHILDDVIDDTLQVPSCTVPLNILDVLDFKTQ